MRLSVDHGYGCGADEQDGRGGQQRAGAAVPPESSGAHGGAHMKTPTMPDDGAIRVSPASTQGMPVAPSAARLERLRRPIAIIAPQPTKPNTPATSRPTSTRRAGY